MKYMLLIGLLLLTLCACTKDDDVRVIAGDVRVIELASGKYSVQIADLTGDWKWFSKNGSDWYGVGRAINRGMLTFSNEDAARDYKEALERQTRIIRVVKCKPQEVEQ